MPAPQASVATRPLALSFGATDLRLRVPIGLEQWIDAESLLRDADAPEPPYWLHLWAGSRALAREVASRASWCGKRVADIGCGLGLAGLVAARLGARVVLVDRVREALALARVNARDNACAVDLVQTDVLAVGLRGPFDVVLLADVTYDPALQQALAQLLAEQLGNEGLALCAESVRNHDPGFRRACERRGLRVGEREVREIDDGRPVPVRLTEVLR